MFCYKTYTIEVCNELCSRVLCLVMKKSKQGLRGADKWKRRYKTLCCGLVLVEELIQARLVLLLRYSFNISREHESSLLACSKILVSFHQCDLIEYASPFQMLAFSDLQLVMLVRFPFYSPLRPMK